MYDLIIIGGGPGGYELALKASQHFNVLLVEQDRIGGTCLNSGCIPTKALYHIAKDLQGLNRISNKGIYLELKGFNLAEAVNYQQEIIDKLNKGMLFELKNSQVELIYGQAKFVSSNSIVVNEKLYQAKYITIATGSNPINLGIPGIHNDNVLDSKGLLQLSELPEKLLVVGAGVIGIELASIYSSFGTEVTILERLPRILPNFDLEIAKRLENFLKRKNIQILTNESAEKIVQEDLLQVHLSSGKVLSVDKVLISVGRTPNIDYLDLEKAGIKYDKKGINVDQNLRTNVNNIFAIGDCNGRYQLAYAASFEAKRVLNVLIGKKDNINFNFLPTCVFTFPEVSSVGYTEEQCKENNIVYQTKKYLFRANGKALTMDQDEGFIKVLVNDNQVIGVHIIGTMASELIHIANVALNAHISISEFLDIIHIHPTLSEIYLDVLK